MNLKRRGLRAAMLMTSFFVVVGAGAGTAYAGTTSGDMSVGGGNQIHAPITAPIELSGNALGILGDAEAFSQGGATALVHDTGLSGAETSGDFSLLGGNQINLPITAPIDVCGNAIAAAGDALAACEGGAFALVHEAGLDGAITSGDMSAVGGNQINLPITAPIDACGNAIAVLGDATAYCVGGAAAILDNAGLTDAVSSGDFSLVGGNQADAPVTVPADGCGNSANLLGDTEAACHGGSSAAVLLSSPWRSAPASPAATTRKPAAGNATGPLGLPVPADLSTVTQPVQGLTTPVQGLTAPVNGVTSTIGGVTPGDLPVPLPL